jgi:hypothetical protein
MKKIKTSAIILIILQLTGCINPKFKATEDEHQKCYSKYMEYKKTRQGVKSYEEINLSSSEKESLEGCQKTSLYERHPKTGKAYMIIAIPSMFFYLMYNCLINGDLCNL